MIAAMQVDQNSDLNPWEARSLLVSEIEYSHRRLLMLTFHQHRFPASGPAPTLGANADPLICPGLYSRSGLDVMSILVSS